MQEGNRDTATEAEMDAQKEANDEAKTEAKAAMDAQKEANDEAKTEAKTDKVNAKIDADNTSVKKDGDESGAPAKNGAVELGEVVEADGNVAADDKGVSKSDTSGEQESKDPKKTANEGDAA
jgi:hypothetical protein